MLKTLLVMTVGLLPSLFSLWVIRRTHSHPRRRTRQVATHSQTPIPERSTPFEGDGARSPLLGDRYYLEGVGYLIGDISCKFNARSGYMRCAVNPIGPCGGCRHYEQRELATTENLF